MVLCWELEPLPKPQSGSCSRLCYPELNLLGGLCQIPTVGVRRSWQQWLVSGFDLDSGGQEQGPFLVVSTGGLNLLAVFAKC